MHHLCLVIIAIYTLKFSISGAGKNLRIGAQSEIQILDTYESHGMHISDIFFCSTSTIIFQYVHTLKYYWFSKALRPNLYLTPK